MHSFLKTTDIYKPHEFSHALNLVEKKPVGFNNTM